MLIVAFALAVKIHSSASFPWISDWNYRNLARIDKAKEEFSFAVFADNKNSINTFDRIIRQVNKDNLLFAIDIGDLVYDGEREKFRFFIEQIEKINRPFLTVIGNHELKENGRASYYDLFGRFYYSFTVGRSYFIILDDANEKNIDPWQMDWLKNELRESQNYKYRFVFMHVPLYDPRQGYLKEGHSLKDIAFARRLNNLFNKYKITMLFCSHIHGYWQGKWQETPYIITGGAGAELVGSNPEHYFYHWIKVNVSDQKVSYEVVKLKSPKYEILDRLLHDGWIYLYAFFAIHSWDITIISGLLYLTLWFILVKKDWLVKRFKKTSK